MSGDIPLMSRIEAEKPGPDQDHPVGQKNQKNWFRARRQQGTQSIAFVVSQAWTLTLLLKHSRVPWTSRFVAGCVLTYLVSPIQLIPSFIPVIGQLDDLLVLFLGMKLIRRLTPVEILRDCEAVAESSMVIRHLVGQRKLPTTETTDAPAA